MRIHKQLPERHIVNKEPREYLIQGKMHCGVYTAKAVLEAFGKGVHKNPRGYHVSFLNKITGTMFRLQDLVNVFKKYGLNTKAVCAKDLDYAQKLLLLKELLLKNVPIPVTIGNGYKYTKMGVEFSKLKSLLVGHFISIWGYDDKEGVFYLYDSGVPKTHYSKNVPIGNIKRTYKDFSRDWKGAIYSRWHRPYTYFEIED